MVERIAPRGARALALALALAAGLAVILTAGYVYGEMRAEQAENAEAIQAAVSQQVWEEENKQQSYAVILEDGPSPEERVRASEARFRAGLAEERLSQAREQQAELWTWAGMWEALTHEEAGA